MVATKCSNIIIIIIIIIITITTIIIIIIISFMQGIYTYIPETNYVRREHSVAAILLLLFMVLISLVSALNLLYFYISTFPKYVCSAQYIIKVPAACPYSEPDQSTACPHPTL